MRIGDYTAHVLVDDQVLEEHRVEFETPTRITCWIASEAGKTFGIEWRCHAETRTKGNAGWVTVDGIFCGGSPMYPGSLGDGDTGEMYGISTDTKTRDFMFTGILLSDDDSLLNKEVPNGFGEISLEIEHGTLVRDRRVRHKNMGIPDDNDKLHETSNKAAHHRISFGPEQARNNRQSKYVSRLNVDDEPSLFFIFKYRPIALLRAHGLVPLPPPSPELDSDDNRHGPKLEPDRSQNNDLGNVELQERIRNTENELKRLQAELEARLSEETRSRRMKREDHAPGSQPDPLVVIDLTGD